MGRPEATFRRLNVLVNNAGILVDGEIRILDLVLALQQDWLGQHEGRDWRREPAGIR